RVLFRSVLLAQLGQCQRYKQYHATAVRLVAGAFAAQPVLAADMASAPRYRGASSAVLAASGMGRDPQTPDAGEAARLRAQALDWLRADLEHSAKHLAGDPLGVVVVVRLPVWQS